MSYLVLVRHGESTWNAVNAWTGLTDISLDEKGYQVAKQNGEILKNINFDISFTSSLRRAQQTLTEIKKTIIRGDLPVIENPALNERDYGDLTGKNKQDVEKEYGEEQYQKWRRSWDCPVPNGETLKDVYERVVPYYEQNILPEIEKEKNVLVVAHGNSLRALVKFLENISDSEIPNLEIAVGEIYIYQMDKTGKIISKEIKKP
ncbi:MAG: 2,3-bisphosphoglycerate-dependent phosphoglycerate mutase [Candidatus Daviesbacteria bacterium]|nr:2,3-bisphosphoglycerate-dependent phosphoglycerate mutase [Candidatus Daviesbacteria bacterium]